MKELVESVYVEGRRRESSDVMTSHDQGHGGGKCDPTQELRRKHGKLRGGDF
jgi:hypothetical protein